MQVPAWLDELSFTAGPPWHAMGTRAVDSATWLTPVRPDRLALKQLLLRDAHDEVAAAAGAGGGGDAAARAAALAAVLAAGIAASELAPALPPLESAAYLVDEDLCLLRRSGRSWILEAGVVCFPSMWSLRSKVGLPVVTVHDPVPAYDVELGQRVDRFLDRLRADRPAWRRNWFVHDTDELHLPTPPEGRAQPRVPDDLWLRSERQTLLRVSRDAILFTIRTDQAPISVLESRPDVGRQMASAIDAWSAELIAYRRAAAWHAPLVAWLEASAGHWSSRSRTQ